MSLRMFVVLLLIACPRFELLAEDKGAPLNPIQELRQKAGVFTYNVFDQSRQTEAWIKLTAINKAHEANPSLTPKDLEALGDLYYRSYLGRNDGSFEDLGQTVLNQIKKLGFEVSYSSGKPVVKVGTSITVETVMDISKEVVRLTRPHDYQMLGGQRLINQPADQWGSSANLVRLSGLIQNSMKAPIIRDSMAEFYKSVTKTSPNDPLSLTLKTNPKAADSEALKLIRLKQDQLEMYLEDRDMKFQEDLDGLRNFARSQGKNLKEVQEAIAAMSDVLNRTSAILIENMKVAQKAEDVRKMLAPGRAAVATAQLFFPNSPAVLASSYVLDASLNIASLVLNDALQSLSVDSFLSVYGIVLNLGSQLYSLFGNKTKPIETIILEQVHALREQVQRLHIAMEEHFRGTDQKLNTIYAEINYRFDVITMTLQQNFTDLRARQRQGEAVGRRAIDATTTLSLHIQRLAQEMQNNEIISACNTLDCQQMATHLKKVEQGFEPLNPRRVEEELSYPDFKASMDRIFLAAYKIDRGTAQTGFSLPTTPKAENFRNFEDEHRLFNRTVGNILSVKGPAYELRTVVEGMKALGIEIKNPETGPNFHDSAVPLPKDQISPTQIAPLDLSELANVGNWTRHAEIYRLYSEKWSDSRYQNYYGRYDAGLVNLGKIIDEGRRLEQILLSIAPTDDKGKPNVLPQLKLVSNYLATLDTLAHVVEEKREVFTRGNLSLKGYNPFANLDSLTPGETSLRPHELFSNGVIPPCDGLSRGPNDFTPQLPPTQANLIAYLAQIPREALVAQDLLGGEIKLCYDEVGGTEPSYDPKIDGDEGIDIHTSRKLYVRLRAEYRTSKGERIPLFKKTLVDSELLKWEKRDYDAKWERRDSKSGVNFLIWVAEEYDEKTNSFIRDQRTAFGRVAGVGKFLGFRLTGLNAQEGQTARFEKLGLKWPELEKKIAASQGLEQMSPDDQNKVRGELKMRIGQFLISQIKDFLNEQIGKDAQARQGTLGDALREVEGARLLLLSGLDLIYGDAIKNRAEVEGFLANIVGENLIAYYMFQNPLRFGDPAQLPRTIESLKEPALAALRQLWEPKVVVSVKPYHAELSKELRNLEKTYSELSSSRNGVEVPKSMNPLATQKRKTEELDAEEVAARTNLLFKMGTEADIGPKQTLEESARTLENFRIHKITADVFQIAVLNKFFETAGRLIPELIQEEAYKTSDNFRETDAKLVKDFGISFRKLINSQNAMPLNWNTLKTETEEKFIALLTQHPGYGMYEVKGEAVANLNWKLSDSHREVSTAREELDRAWAAVLGVYGRSGQFKFRLPYLGAQRGPVAEVFDFTVKESQNFFREVHQRFMAVPVGGKLDLKIECKEIEALLSRAAAAGLTEAMDTTLQKLRVQGHDEKQKAEGFSGYDDLFLQMIKPGELVGYALVEAVENKKLLRFPGQIDGPNLDHWKNDFRLRVYTSPGASVRWKDDSKFEKVPQLAHLAAQIQRFSNGLNQDVGVELALSLQPGNYDPTQAKLRSVNKNDEALEVPSGKNILPEQFRFVEALKTPLTSRAEIRFDAKEIGDSSNLEFALHANYEQVVFGRIREAKK